MGIKGFTKAIKRFAPGAIKTLSYQELADISKNKVYGVDVFSYLYPTQYNVLKKSKGNHIREFMEMISTWASVGIRLVFVFDGNTNSEAKRETVDERTDRRLKGQAHIQKLIHDMNAEQESSIEDEKILVINQDLHTAGHDILSSSKGTTEQRIDLELALRSHIIVSGDKVNDLITLFQLVGATYMRAEGEADFLLSMLYNEGYIDGVISEDCDMLTHGVERLVRGFTDSSLRRVGHVSVYSTNSILDGAQISMNQFIDFCILCGCDYCPKIKGIAAITALSLLKKHSNITNILSGIEDGTIKNQPDGISLEEYQMRYERAFMIFSKDQEQLPVFDIKGYIISDSFRDWILMETNYTENTLENKIKSITEQQWTEHTPKKPKSITKIPVKKRIKVQIKPKN